MSADIIVKNLKKSFGANQVLRGIDISAEKGSSLAVIGGSGSGKSVLLKSIIGLLQPDDGSRVVVDGKDLTNVPIFKRTDFLENLGVLFQGGALFDSLNVWQNICFSLMQSGRISAKHAPDYAASKLQLVGLAPDVVRLYPSELSGGMQKRVALARSIADNPRLIFFDEPTTGLDPINSTIISNLISRLSKDLGATTITITHDMNCVRIVADNVAMLHNGKIIWHGNEPQLHSSGNELVDNFVNGRA